MARQSPGRRNADERLDTEEPVDAPADTTDTDDPDAAGSSADGTDSPDDEQDPDGGPAPDRDRALWSDTRIDPIELALPVGTGYTLRAYRMASTLTPTEMVESDEDDPFARRRAAAVLDDEDTVADGELDAVTDTVPDLRRQRDTAPDEPDRDADSDADEDRTEPEAADDELPDELDEEEAEQEEQDEEVPVFLSHRGKVLLFRSAPSLVAFIRSGAPNDLAQVDTWTELAERIEPDDVVAREEDVYELDLVVENLRGGHDAWDVDLVIKAGEIARDLGYSLRLEPVLTALAPDSPLDTLDEAARKTASGGLGGFLGRRRLRKIGAQQATLGWRTIIGKISGAVDWRD